VHLHRRVHFNLVGMHLHTEQVILQMHLTSRLNISLASGSEVQIRISLRSSSFHPRSVGLFAGIMDMGAITHILAWKTLPARCRSKALLVGGILSTTLDFCENTFIRTRSTSLPSLNSLEYSLQTKCDATFSSRHEVSNGVSTTAASS
jgi:hypothetical protein